MTNISGIQLSSKMVLNTAEPLDGKQRLNTSDRLNLTTTQRWLGMTIYDTDENKWKLLINNPATIGTSSSDWKNFVESSTISFNIANEYFDVIDSANLEYQLNNIPIINSVTLTLNGLENEEGEHYTVDGAKITFANNINYKVGQRIGIKYFY